ncbi:MAG: type II secretion system protein GspD [Planctomycetota bacterium]
MLLRGFVLVVVLSAGLATMGFAQEVGQDLPPDELPTHLIKVLRTTNKAQTNRYVPKVYSVSNVNPYSLFRWVKRTAQIEEGAIHFFGKPEVPGDWDSVKSGKVVVVLPEYMLPGVDELMRIIDREGLTSSAGEVFFYFRPKHRSVEDDGFTDLIRALSLSSTSSSAKRADVEANMFLLYDAPSAIEDVKRFMPLIDVPPPQVLIEVTVYEIKTENESKLGLDYVSWKNGPGRNLFAFSAFREREKISSLSDASPLLETGTGDTYGLPGHGFRTSGHNYAWFLDVSTAFFDFLVVKGKARVMTASRLLTRNLVPATMAAGDTILYYHARAGDAPVGGIRAPGLPLDPTGSDPAYPDNRTVVSTQADRELTGATAGVELEIVPIIAEDEINLQIFVGLVSHTGFDDSGAPVLAERLVESEVLVRDGQEIVLGGYSREVYVERADKIPVLGSLPIIGYLFGGDSHTTERRQVVLVLRAHIVTDFSAMNVPGATIDAALIRSKALREVATEVPETSFGFDQWLLDEEQK